MKNKLLTALCCFMLAAMIACFDGNAFDITIAENTDDVYVAGSYYGNDENNACYWKNGKLTVLEPSDSVASEGFSIAVDGQDVYIAGSYNNNFHACYWKNGTRNSLDTEAQSIAYSIFTSNGDIYVAGAYNNGNKACYWLNGTVHVLSDFGGTREAKHIFVDGK